MSYLRPGRRALASPFARSATRMGLGDAVATGTPESQVAYQTAALTELKNISAWQQRWVEKDEQQRWIQIGATVAIPLFAAGWKLLGRFLSRGE